MSDNYSWRFISFCDYLIENGFYAISLSDVVRQDLKENGRSVDRDSLTQRANELKTQHGLTYFAETCFSQVVELGHQKVVFDSIRHPLEAAFLKEKGVIVSILLQVWGSF